MNGIHDLGGMHGFGEIPKDEANFHADWERTVFGQSKLLAPIEGFSLHEKRHATERIDPAAYLDLPYYGRWLLSTQTLLEERGVIEEGAVEQRMAELAAGEASVPERTDDDLVELSRDVFEAKKRTRVEDGPEPAFDAGDRVVVSTNYHEGHTRAPRYTQRCEGVVDQCRGAFELPDAVVAGERVDEQVYAVEFTHRVLFGEEYPESDRLYIDMWESYLEPADGA